MTSAEIKVVILRQCWTGLRNKARKIFKKHGLDKTAKHNCVLIVLVTTNREFLIYGDEGIHEKVGQHFWDEVQNVMIEKFRENEAVECMKCGIIISKFLGLKSKKDEKKGEVPKKQEKYANIPGVKGSILNFIDEQIDRFKFFL